MLLEGKKAAIFGVANQRSIAYGIASAFKREGAQLCFSYLGDALKKRVEPISEELGGDFTFPCNVAEISLSLRSERIRLTVPLKTTRIPPAVTPPIARSVRSFLPP